MSKPPQPVVTFSIQTPAQAARRRLARRVRLAAAAVAATVAALLIPSPFFDAPGAQSVTPTTRASHCDSIADLP